MPSSSHIFAIMLKYTTHLGHIRFIKYSGYKVKSSKVCFIAWKGWEEANL